MKPPLLNRSLTLEDPQQLADGSGGFATTWVTLGALWAEVTAGSGRERAGRGTTLSRVPFKITVRAAPAGASSRPKPNQRFRDGDRVFAILAVSERDPTGKYLLCHTEEETVA